VLDNQKTSVLNNNIVNNIKAKNSSVKGSPKRNVKSFANKNMISLISQLANVNKNRFNLFFSKLSACVKLGDSQNTTIMPLKDMYLTLLKKSNVTMLSNKYKFYSDVSLSNAVHLVDNEFNPGYIDITNNMQTSSLNNSILFNYNYSTSGLTINKTKPAQVVSVNGKSLSLMDNKHSNGLLIKLNNLYRLFVLDSLANSSTNDSASSYKLYESVVIGKNTFNKISNDNTREERLKLISAKSVNIINKVRKYKNFLLKILR